MINPSGADANFSVMNSAMRGLYRWILRQRASSYPAFSTCSKVALRLVFCFAKICSKRPPPSLLGSITNSIETRGEPAGVRRLKMRISPFSDLSKYSGPYWVFLKQF